MKLVDDTITVFNKYVDNETKFKRYKATVINGVHWYGTANVSVTADGLIGADQYTIRIPEEADFSGKQYISPKSFEAQENKDSYFTLAEGDIIVHGSVSSDIDTPSYLQAMYDEAVTVVSVTDNRRAPNAKHWRVVCK